MKRILLALGFVVACWLVPTGAQAQQPVVIQCGTGNPTNPWAPCPTTGGALAVSGTNNPSYTPLTPGQYSLAIVSATALTAPATADFADVQAIGQTVNYTLDGTTTPTSSVGTQLYAGQHLYLYGASMIAAAKFIQTAATATINVNYAK